MSPVINVLRCHSALMSYHHVVLIRPKQYNALLNCLNPSLDCLNYNSEVSQLDMKSLIVYPFQ